MHAHKYIIIKQEVTCLTKLTKYANLVGKNAVLSVAFKHAEC